MTVPIVIMGVSGCGKSTLGRALATALGRTFVEGDALHPPENVAKMAAGIALDDRDRRPFLEAVARAIVAQREHGAGVVAACSALKRRYRDLIRDRVGPVTFVLPQVDPGTLRQRLARRKDHYMPVSLLLDQLSTLEQPEADEGAVLVDGTLDVGTQVAQVLALLPQDSSRCLEEDTRRE